MVATVEFPELRCYCKHKRLQHALGQEKCDNCNCSHFRLDLGPDDPEKELDNLRGDLCVVPSEAAQPSQASTVNIEQGNRGSVNTVQLSPIAQVMAGLPPDSGLKDSGQRLQFASGMVRDVDHTKPAFDLVIPEGIPYEELMLTRWAELLRKGAIKYARRNWEKADSDEELQRAKASAFRHFMQWFTEENDEDHAAAVFFNINEVETIKYKQRTKETG